jgi:hypothetical protein
MIHISKTDDLSFTVRFDPRMAEELSAIASWGTVEDALSRILTDILLGHDPYPDFSGDLEDDVPF